MELTERIDSDLKDAMKARDKVRVRTLRSLRAALLEKEIAERKGGEATLSEQQTLATLQKQAKQRRDSIEQFEEGGRNDLADAERKELEVIETYLPKQLGKDEIREVVERIIDRTGASSMGDMGKVMGPVMGELRGKADGKLVNEVVKELLQS